MYIEPNTTIKILENVPLDPTYDHTLYWNTETAQNTYFSSKAKYTLSRQSYQRVSRGWMRVDIMAENLYDCNYIMFKNTAFGDKWFYAYLTSVEYVNNNVSQIEFEIDVMQTWFFDYYLEQCFVEREHTATDNLFENIIKEDLEIGDEYVCNAIERFSMNDMAVCILLNKLTPSTGTTIGSVTNNIYTPVQVIAGLRLADPDFLNDIETIMEPYVEDDIVCIYQYPSFLGDASTQAPESAQKTITANLTAIDGYVPRNKKLFCYPYNFLQVTNNCGQNADYRWEDWGSSSIGQFTITGVFLTTPSVICYPTAYRGVVNAYEDGITLSNFPQCAWGGDTFKAWWAQNKASFVTSGITSVLSSMMGGSLNGATAAKGGAPTLPSAGTAALSAFSTVTNMLATVEDIKNTPSQMHGQTQTDSLNPGMGRLSFDFYSMSIKAQYARIVDDYFDRYGYAIRRNKYPNTHARPHWTFTKTVGCTITGSLPGDDIRKICSIYDKGITFWMSPAEVGDYSLDNRPV